jgi:hypothetical protein
MSHDDYERVDHYKAQVRSMQDRKLIESFRFNGLTLGDMDRAELLGVICFLANNPSSFVRKVETVKFEDKDPNLDIR